MTKTEFKAELASRLSGIPLSERAKPLDYYDEIICDRIEDGMTEEEAVAALGDIDKIAGEILCSLPITSLVKAKVAEHREAYKSKPHTMLWIILAVLGSPIWFPLLIMVLCLILTIYVLIWSLIATLFAVVLAVALGGIFGIGFALKTLFISSSAYTFCIFGAALILLGTTFLLIPLVFLCIRGAVSLTKAFGNSIKRQFIR
jgi:uncharacterized membrane protein